MDDKLRARLDAMDARIDGAMYGISTAIWAVLEDPKMRLDIIGKLSHFLADRFVQEDVPPAFLEGVKMIRDRVVLIETMDQKVNHSN